MCDSFNIQWSRLNVTIEKKTFSYRKWKNITDNATILQNASGYMGSGDFVAVLGPSGSGKTTLIAAISQRLRGHVTGDVRVNGLLASRRDMTKLSAFVPQFDIMMKELTPREHLYFMGELKMDRTWSAQRKDARINALLWRLGLQHVADTRIERLSGGERKKLNLATDLLTDPPIMFCDEPTTGLDTFSALNVVKALKRLTVGAAEVGAANVTATSVAKGFVRQENDVPNEMEMFHKIGEQRNSNIGKAIMCSIHHPTAELFEIFTHVILMHSGSMAFQGTLHEAQEFFMRQGFKCPLAYNPAEFYIKIVSRKAKRNARLREALGTFQVEQVQMCKWNAPNKSIITIVNVERISWFTEFLILMRRSNTHVRRTITDHLWDLLIFLIMSLVIAFIYSTVAQLDQSSPQNVEGAIYIITAQIVFRTSYGVQHVFPAMLPILRRETGENIYSLSACYVSTFICRIPMHCLDVLTILGAIFAFSGFLNEFWLFIRFAFILIACAITANAYGCMVSGVFESKRTSAEIAPLTDVLFSLMSGQYLSLHDYPLLKLISLFFYTSEALSLTYWHDVTKLDCPVNGNSSCFHNGPEVLQSYMYSADYSDIWLDYLGLLILTAIMHLIGFFGIRRLTKKVGFY